MRRFYIADTHFGHEAVIRMCNRPFSSIDEMDAALITNWNSVVSSEDEVFILGDLIFKSKHTPHHYLDQLKGKKHLILGKLRKVDKSGKAAGITRWLNGRDIIGGACTSSDTFTTTEIVPPSSFTGPNQAC